MNFKDLVESILIEKNVKARKKKRRKKPTVYIGPRGWWGGYWPYYDSTGLGGTVDGGGGNQ